MDGPDAVTDPTDWAGTAVTSLQSVDNLLRCAVCKEFFDTPVITSCAHTFCSLCIRRCLTHDGKCPTCRTEDQPIRLRRNWTVEEVVNAFRSARPEVLRLGREAVQARHSSSAPSLKRKLGDVSLAEEGEQASTGRRKTRSQGRRAAPSQSPSTYEDSDYEEQEEPRERRISDGKVECPICQVRMKEEEVFAHIDRAHSEPSSTPAKAQPVTFGVQRDVRSPSAATGLKPPERLSGLSYGIMNETALRKKLQNMGIASYGSKQHMIRRHQEWLNIWNANCDSTRPRPKRDLLRDLETWERTQGSQARNGDNRGIMAKEFDGKAWAQSNDDDFKRLIAAARFKRAKPPSENEPGVSPTNGTAASANAGSEAHSDQNEVT